MEGSSIVPHSGGTGERAGVYAIDHTGAPNSIGDATGAGFRGARYRHAGRRRLFLVGLGAFEPMLVES